MERNYVYCAMLLIAVAIGVSISTRFYFRTSLSLVNPNRIYYTMHNPTPVRITIPSIHVNALIESTGEDSFGDMGVPKIPKDTAWYSLGPKPGEIGNAVIDGHVDTQTGAPAVFAHLKNVPLGGKIIIYDTNNIKHVFIVTMIKDVQASPFPVNQIFGTSSGKHLNLITCAGIWDNETRNYNKRLVVFSRLYQQARY